MRVALTAAILTGVLAVTGSVFAAEGAQRQNPYANLFKGQLNGTTPPRTLTPTPVLPFVATPTVRLEPDQIRCGMLVMQGDAVIDPKMGQRMQIPPNGPTPTIRVVQPPICGR